MISLAIQVKMVPTILILSNFVSSANPSSLKATLTFDIYAYHKFPVLVIFSSVYG